MVNHPNRRRKVAKASAYAAPTHNHDADYAAFLAAVQSSFDTATAPGAPLFCTTADGLNDTYLSALPAERQVHTCTACRHFIERFGGLVTIGKDGALHPAMWSAKVPDFYWPALIAMATLAQRARVEGPFLSPEATWGTPQTHNRAKGIVWSHLSVRVPAAVRFRERALTAGQAMAAKREDFGTVARALADFTAPMLDEALRLLETDSLSRAERFIGPVKWLRTLHDRPKGNAGQNVLWRAIASAPDGYCHPRASVIGSLLEDIVDGMPFEDNKSRWAAKMHPLQYQRPQAPPSAGNIAAAEAMIEKLGIARSLERRFARLDEIETIWRPKDATPPSSGGGVFGHLKAKEDAPPPAVDIPPVTMTWEKFRRTALEGAEALELLAPSVGPYIALTTAEHADAPLIFRWDHPVAWYLWGSPAPAHAWGVRAGWTKVTAVSPLPPMWGDKPRPFLGEGVIFVLAGCVDSRETGGNALFPECLRGDLHSVRSTIEAYSRSAKIGGRAEASACGYDLRKSPDSRAAVRVLNNGRWTAYKIDRWD